MTRNRHTLLVAIGLALVLHSPALVAQGGGIAAYEVGTPNLGEAYAGQAAVAEDASTAFLNPAGMTRLPGTHLLAGGQLDLLSARFLTAPAVSMSGGGGGNAGGTFLLPSAYFTRSFNDRFTVGLSFNSPFGLGLHYDDKWAGRYEVQQIRLAVTEAMPSAAYRVNRWLSLGAGLSLERASLAEKIAIPSPFGDGQLSMRLHGWGTGLHAGALLEPSDRTRIGVAYRSDVSFTLQGNTAIRAPLSLPRGANLSLYRDLNLRLALLADTGWANWRNFGRPNWKDTWRAGLGMRWRLAGRTMLHAGASYESSPVSYWNRTPDLPVDRQWRLAFGVTRTIDRFLSIALSATYADLGSGRIENSRLSGQYGAARLPFFSLSFLFKPGGAGL
jgi:long-chain fatty acid transport protein